MVGLDFGFGPLEAEFWRWLFLMTRIGAALVAAPFFGANNVSSQVRVSLTAAVALLVAGWTKTTTPDHVLSVAGMVAVMGEVTIGLALGFVLQVAFAVPTIAAEVIGNGMGFGIAASVDPANGAHTPALGQYFGVILTVIFFGSGGHLQWFALLVKSYAVFPPGHVLGHFGQDQFMMIVSFGSALLATAVTMALPVSLLLLIIQLMAGIISRSAPALNVFSLGMPAAIVGGVMAIMASLPMLSDRMTELSQQAIADVAQLLGG